MTRHYRVIRPATEWAYHGQHAVHNPTLLWVNGKLINKKRNISLSVGDIVDMEQINEWISYNLHPLYFTEEVININTEKDPVWVNLSKCFEMIKLSGERYNESVASNKELRSILEAGNWIDNYNLQGFFIETNEEDDKLIREIKGIGNGD